jgi:DNA-binding protein H-NS
MATLESIEIEIAKLQAQYRAQLVALVLAIMTEHGLTVDDLTGTRAAPIKAKPKAKPAAKKAKPAKKTRRKRGPQPAKYRNPETGETWSGMARPPAWIKDVPNRDAFLIQ